MIEKQCYTEPEVEAPKTNRGRPAGSTNKPKEVVSTVKSDLLQFKVIRTYQDIVFITFTGSTEEWKMKSQVFIDGCIKFGYSPMYNNKWNFIKKQNFYVGVQFD